MDNELEKSLFDVLESISIIEKHLINTKDYSSFSSNLLVKDAVQRRLAIIGEAIWKAYKLLPSIVVTDIKKIIGLRHVLVHDYDKIETPSIWLIVTKYLPILKNEIEIILKQRDGFTSN